MISISFHSLGYEIKIVIDRGWAEVQRIIDESAWGLITFLKCGVIVLLDVDMYSLQE